MTTDCARRTETQLLGKLWSLLDNRLLQRWYPLALDRERGGFFTNISNDGRILPDQEKMVVSQARHIWTTAKAAGFVPEGTCYGLYARHGYRFFIDRMWDAHYGGFYQIRSRGGEWSDVGGWHDEKRVNGNAAGISALAALYDLTHDPDVLSAAKNAFRWIEEHAFDPIDGGYFQFLDRDGTPLGQPRQYAGVAVGAAQAACKDLNSTIHLLEAYTELFRVWRSSHLRDQLGKLLALVRDTMVRPPGYLPMHFSRDWKPVSVHNSSEYVQQGDYSPLRVSFGHDCEAAFLMLEASFVLGIQDDAQTLAVAKKILDHALAHGWDRTSGGFYDNGEEVPKDDQFSIVRPTKSWWAQAEALNALLFFSEIFPEETTYEQLFLQEWGYIDRFLLNHTHGDWFEEDLDQQPGLRTGPKGNMWKSPYHTAKTLMNCIALLSDGKSKIPVPTKKKRAVERLIEHWKKA